MFYPESRLKFLADGNTRVTIEGNKPVNFVSEVNYKFKLNNYLDQIKDWIISEKPIWPPNRTNDLRSLFEENIADLSVSRSRLTNPWGIQVPDDPEQTIYVWLDALSNYLVNGKNLPDVHVIGKDILKFHAIYWPAFLLAAGLDLPKRILVHGHWKVSQEKMSKSLGNVVDPNVEMDRFGVDGFRYLLLRIGRPDSDDDYDPLLMINKYNNELCNVFGNLISRIRNPKFYPKPKLPIVDDPANRELIDKVTDAFDEYKFYWGLELIMKRLNDCNAFVNEVKPWILAKENRSDELSHVMSSILSTILTTTQLMYPVMPSTSLKVLKLLQHSSNLRLDLKADGLDISRLSEIQSIFPRI